MHKPFLGAKVGGSSVLPLQARGVRTLPSFRLSGLYCSSGWTVSVASCLLFPVHGYGTFFTFILTDKISKQYVLYT